MITETGQVWGGGSSLEGVLVTFSVHFLMRVLSSDTTRSTHFRLGSFSFRICFFTMASKARSGVNSPVLEQATGLLGKQGKFSKRESQMERDKDRRGEKEREQGGRNRERDWDKGK